MSDETIPTCIFIDPFGYPVACEQMDPCVPESGTTLWHMVSCDGLVAPLSEFCLTYPDHPFCEALTTTTVEVGVPPTLPVTGGDPFMGGVIGIVIGLLLVIAAKR